MEMILAVLSGMLVAAGAYLMMSGKTVQSFTKRAFLVGIVCFYTVQSHGLQMAQQIAQQLAGPAYLCRMGQYRAAVIENAS